jgi:putative hydrolase
VSEPSDDDAFFNPFGAMPMFGDLAKMLQGQGPLNWDVARQMALGIATNGAAEPNVDPAVRFALNDLARIAEMHVQELTGLTTTVAGRSIEIVAVTPGGWAQRTLDAYRPLMVDLATSLGQRPPAGDDVEAAGDPMMAMMAGLSQMMAPAMMGMSVGSMVGRLATRAFGQYDLPIPRPATHEILVVPATVDAFAADWSLPLDEVRLWVCLQELTAHAVLLVPHIGEAIRQLVQQHVSGFRPDPASMAEKLGSMEIESSDPMQAFQRVLGDPEVLLGAVESPAQREQRPRLDALVSLIVGYVDHVVDRATPRLLASGGGIAEAIRRRRIESSPEDVFVERLLGLTLTRHQVERGKAFVSGVVERAGDNGLAQLWSRPDAIPTPAEMEAPGLWLARLEFEV